MNKIKIVIAAITAAAAAVGSFHAKKYLLHTDSNTEHMNDSIDYGLSLIGKRFRINKEDAGEYSDMKMLRTFRIHVDRYVIDGLGNLAVMTTKTPMMQMSSIVITPWGKNVPMASFDLMYTLAKRKFIIEFYDLVTNRDSEEYRSIISELSGLADSYSDLHDIPAKEGGDGWFEECRPIALHKQFTMKEDARGLAMFLKMLRTYLDAASRTDASSPEDTAAQQVIVKDYVDHLLEDSGVSTAMFKKGFGVDFTREFFYNAFFKWSDGADGQQPAASCQ